MAQPGRGCLLGIGISGVHKTLSEAEAPLSHRTDPQRRELGMHNPRGPEPPRRNVITTTNREVTHEQYNQVTCDNVNDATTGRSHPCVPRSTAPCVVNEWPCGQRA